MLESLPPLVGIPGGPELVVIALMLLPLLILGLIGAVLVRRLLALPDPSRVTDLEREVLELRERVDRLEEHVDGDADAGVDADAGSDGENWGE